MSTEGATLPTAPAWSQRSAALPRFRLQLTGAERRLLLVLGDLVQINGALLLAIVVWNRFEFSLNNVLACAKWFVTLSVIWFILANVLDSYNLARATDRNSVVSTAAPAALLTSIIYVLVPWLTPPIETRLYVFGFVAVSVGMIALWRILYARALARPSFLRRALFLGPPEGMQALRRDLASGPDDLESGVLRGAGYEIVGMLPIGSAERPCSGDEPGELGAVRDLVSIVRCHGVDEIIVALDPRAELAAEDYERLLDCRELGLQVTSLPAFHERVTSRLPVAYARYDPAIVLDPSNNTSTRLYLAAKRLLDLVFALVGLAVLAVIGPLVALGNLLFSRGPLSYRQQRVGQGGRPFKVVKFRSMRVDAEEATGAVWCGDADHRITPMGRWLRRLRLDELPQVLNVLAGEMSVVGPRPERPQFAGELTHQMPIYRARHSVKPGITGWAQTHYGYGSSVEDARIKLEYDLYYVKHMSLRLDFLIILQTIAVMLQLKGR